MARSVLIIIVGVVAGAIAVHFLGGDDPTGRPLTASGPAPERTSPPAASPPPTAIDAESLGSATDNTEARIAAWQRAAAAVDALDVESMITLAAASPASFARDLEIEALLTKLAEFDPVHAVDFALSAFLETRFVLHALENLARVEPDAAIAAIGAVTPPARQYQLALALLDTIGYDDNSVARIAAVLPPGAGTGFGIDAIVASASRDPMGALTSMLSLQRPSLQSLYISRLAEVLAESDPVGALALIRTVDDYSLRRSFQSALFLAWSRIDSEQIFSYLANADSSELIASTSAFAAMARIDSDRLIAMRNALPPAIRSTVDRAVLQVLAEEDAVAAIAMLDTMPPGQDRENLLSTIANTYGRQNPDVAIAWARSLSPPSETALRGVLQGIASIDVDRAIDLFLEELDSQAPAQLARSTSLGSSLSLSMMLSLVSSNGGDVSRLANRLIEFDSPQMSSMLSLAMSVWSSRDSEAALGWAIANVDRIEPNLLSNLASSLADQNLDLALSTMERLPSDKREGWMLGVVRTTARADFDTALRLLDRFRGQPGYEQAYASATTELARSDPVAAARMLENATSAMAARNASFTIAREWAMRDPESASQWALELTDAQVRDSAMTTIATTWAERDAAAAERWLMQLTRGPARDAAVDGYLQTAAFAGDFDPELLDAYSSDQARQRGASRAIVALGRTSPEEAERMMDQYITDAAIRAQTEEQLLRSSAVGGGIFISNGIIISR